MITNRDFSDLFSEFAAHDVRYLVVGAYAVAHYAIPRFTKDIDVWVGATPENAIRVWRALASYGAPMAEISPDTFETPGQVFQIGVTTTRIDVLTSVAALDFEDCWPRRTRGTYGDVEVFYVSRDDLLRNKRSVARPRDLQDVRVLEKAMEHAARRGTRGKGRKKR